MTMTITFDEINLLYELFKNVDVDTLSTADLDIFEPLNNNIVEIVEQHEADLLIAKTDFHKQLETGNFRYLCSACSDISKPSCRSLYDDKYCKGIYNCTGMINNPDYKEEV